jgi:hypothetical protein
LGAALGLFSAAFFFGLAGYAACFFEEFLGIA